MPSSTTNIKIRAASAVDYVNYHYYSCPMTQFNIGKIVFPCPPSLESVTSSSGREYKIRISHGLLHALSAMESIENILQAYQKYVPTFKAAFKSLSEAFEIEEKTLIELIKIAILFHDSARKGDGQDLWDEDSADACYDYLTRQLKVPSHIAHRIADTIRYKDDQTHYVSKHTAQYDILRELVNMADNLEVLRCRDTFDPSKLAIFQHVKTQEEKHTLIDELVVPHRKRIFDEGRLHRKGHIVFPGYNDKRENIGQSGYQKQKIADTFEEACKKYPDVAILNIDSEDDRKKLVKRALRGVETFIKQHKPNQNGSSPTKFFANTRFCPFGHSPRDYQRAKDVKRYLTSDSNKLYDKVDLILKIAECTKGKYYPTNTMIIPLNLEIQRSLGHYSDFDTLNDEFNREYLTRDSNMFCTIMGKSSYLLAAQYDQRFRPENYTNLFLDTPHAHVISHFFGNQTFLDLFDELDRDADAMTYQNYMIRQSSAINALAHKDSSRTRFIGLSIAFGTALAASAGVLLINPLFATLFILSVATLIITQIMAHRNETKVSSWLTEINNMDQSGFNPS